MYSDFSDFSNDLGASLLAGDQARSMHAHGKYDAGANEFTAYKLGIHLLEPQ